MDAFFAAMIQAEIDGRRIERYIGSLRSHVHGKRKTVRQRAMGQSAFRGSATQRAVATYLNRAPAR
jgi:hypothetical protein